jgi:hypothetical protein
MIQLRPKSHERSTVLGIPQAAAWGLFRSSPGNRTKINLNWPSLRVERLDLNDPQAAAWGIPKTVERSCDLGRN